MSSTGSPQSKELNLHRPTGSLSPIFAFPPYRYFSRRPGFAKHFPLYITPQYVLPLTVPGLAGAPGGALAYQLNHCQPARKTRGWQGKQMPQVKRPFSCYFLVFVNMPTIREHTEPTTD